MTRGGHPSLAAAAIDAVTQLLSKGSSQEHVRLWNADIFLTAVRLYENPSQRQLSLKLLGGIIRHLCYTIILNKEFAEWLFSLFESVLTYTLQAKSNFFPYQ